LALGLWLCGVFSPVKPVVGWIPSAGFAQQTGIVVAPQMQQVQQIQQASYLPAMETQKTIRTMQTVAPPPPMQASTSYMMRPQMSVLESIREGPPIVTRITETPSIMRPPITTYYEGPVRTIAPITTTTTVTDHLYDNGMSGNGYYQEGAVYSNEGLHVQ
jgi:hypothetical protein